MSGTMYQIITDGIHLCYQGSMKSESMSFLLSLHLKEELRAWTWSLKNWVNSHLVTSCLSLVLPVHREECGGQSNNSSVVSVFHHLLNTPSALSYANSPNLKSIILVSNFLNGNATFSKIINVQYST